MRRALILLTIAGLMALPCAIAGQTVDWPTHYGDYSGRRYSPLAHE